MKNLLIISVCCLLAINLLALPLLLSYASGGVALNEENTNNEIESSGIFVIQPGLIWNLT